MILSERNTYFNGNKWPPHVGWDDCDFANAWIDPGPSPAGNRGPYLKVEWPYGRLCDGGTDEVLVARIYPRRRVSKIARDAQGRWAAQAAKDKAE
jgi:hypothetical protein